MRPAMAAYFPPSDPHRAKYPWRPSRVGAKPITARSLGITENTDPHHSTLFSV